MTDKSSFEEYEQLQKSARRANLQKHVTDLRRIVTARDSVSIDMSGEVQAYIEKCTAEDDLYYEVWPAVSSAIAAVALGVDDLEIEEYSNFSELSGGIIRAIYMRAMRDCAKVFGVPTSEFYETISHCIDDGINLNCPNLVEAVEQHGSP